MNIQIDLPAGKGSIHGICDDRFERVLDAFVRNFGAGDAAQEGSSQKGSPQKELGASVCLNVAGETLVDLWGGKVSPKRDAAADWGEDTVSVVFSCTKAAVAFCAHHLIARGSLSPYARVVDYWPTFGAEGKEETTVAMMLNHSAGLPAFRSKIKTGGFLDWDYMVQRLADEAPFWPPGTRNGYHMSTFGWTVGELVRRVSGESLGQYFKHHIADPLGLDFHIGMPTSEHHRVSRMMRWAPKKGEPLSPFTQALLHDPNSLQYLALLNAGGYRTDSADSYRAEYGAGGGITNARGLAGMYRPLANGGGNLVDQDGVDLMGAVSVATQEDATLLMPSRFSLGFMVSMDNRYRETGQMESMVLGKHGFGHAGAGGSVGFADPECHLGFGYTMNRMGAGILLNERGQSLVDAAYQSLGYRTNKPGFWVR